MRITRDLLVKYNFKDKLEYIYISILYQMHYVWIMFVNAIALELEAFLFVLS